MSKLTVAAFRSHYGRQIKCFDCDELHDVSVLDRVWEEWGPDAVITIDHDWVREPNDPLDLRPTRTRYLQRERPRDDGEDCASPEPGRKVRLEFVDSCSHNSIALNCCNCTLRMNCHFD